MIKELEDDVTLFDQADRAVDVFAQPYRVNLGVTESKLQKWMARHYDERGLKWTAD